MKTLSLLVTAAGLLASAASAHRLGAGGTMIANDSEIPHCPAVLGTVSLVEEKKASTPNAAFPPQIAAFMALARAQGGMSGGDVDPIPLLKLLVARSACFSVVDRGAGFNAVQRERELANGNQLTNSATGNGATLTPSDYVLVAQIVYSNENAGGRGGGLGGLGGGYGGLGGISSRTKAVQTLLTLTTVKTGVQAAVAERSARKKDLKIGGGGLVGMGIGALGGYQNTAIEQITAAALLDSYGKLVPQLDRLAPVTASAIGPAPAAGAIVPQPDRTPIRDRR